MYRPWMILIGRGRGCKDVNPDLLLFRIYAAVRRFFRLLVF